MCRCCRTENQLISTVVDLKSSNKSFQINVSVIIMSTVVDALSMQSS